MPPVAVADRALSFGDRAGVSAFGYLAACIILPDYTAEIGILSEFLEIRGDLHLADHTARSIDADWHRPTCSVLAETLYVGCCETSVSVTVPLLSPTTAPRMNALPEIVI